MSRLSRGFETEQTPAFDFMLKKKSNRCVKGSRRRRRFTAECGIHYV